MFEGCFSFVAGARTADEQEGRSFATVPSGVVYCCVVCVLVVYLACLSLRCHGAMVSVYLRTLRGMSLHRSKQ